MPRRLPTRALPALAAALPFAAALAAPAQRYEGIAHALRGGELLYREVHYRYAAEDGARHLVLYRCPDAGAFARKLLHEAPSPSAPDFDFVDARSGYREGVRREGTLWHVYVQDGTGAPLRSQRLPVRAEAVIDAGFDHYVRSHWDALGQGVAHVPFLLPSRLGYVDIALSDAREAIEDGQAVRRLRMRLDAWYAFVAPVIHLAYTVEPRRLRAFEGIGSIRDGNGRHRAVRIEFPPAARTEVPQAEIEAALAEPLDGRCAT
jgi:hypothetical protein